MVHHNNMHIIVGSKRATGSRRSTRKTTGKLARHCPPATCMYVCGFVKKSDFMMSYSWLGRSIIVGDSDDDGEPNTYDYNDSFIDDEGQFNYQVPACERGSS